MWAPMRALSHSIFAVAIKSRVTDFGMDVSH